jgi:hypothetical protein
MDKKFKEIWISGDHTGPMLGGQKYTDDNNDVIVTFTDGSRYVASFFTYQNIVTLTEKNKRTGELLGGKYFWASDMILIDRVDRESIEKVIDDLINDDCFDQVFKLVQ